MPNLSLPRVSLPQRRYLIPIILLAIFVFLIFVGEGVYYFLRVARPRSELQREIQRRADINAKVGKERYEKVAQEIETQQEILKEKRPLLTEKCRLVPLIDPMFGISRIDKKTNSIADYYYEAKIISVEEIDYLGCNYIKLTLEIRDEFEISIPSALLAKTDLGEVSALLYQGHIGERVQIKIRYEQNASNPEILKILEWQPLVFVIE